MQKCLDRYSVSSWCLKGWRDRSLLEPSASEETAPESGSMALGSKGDSVGPVWSLQQRVSIKQSRDASVFLFKLPSHNKGVYQEVELVKEFLIKN